ncbi:MAG: TonB family protein [Cyanophyceae cyanobacterium]
MSFASALNTLPAKLLRPNSMAILASLGFHALLFTALPNLSLSPREEASSLSVRVTELSPAEQARLPNFAPPLNPYALPDASVVTPRLNTFPLELPNATTLLPPPSAQSSNQAPVTSILPDLPTVPLPPPPSFAIVPPQPSAPPEKSVESPAPASETPPPTASIPAPPLNSLPPLPQQSTLPTLPQNPNRALRFSPPAPSISARDLLNQQRANAGGSATSPEAGDSDNQQAANSSELPPAAPTDIETLRQQNLVAEVLELRASLAKDETDTTNEEALKNDLNWRQANQVAEPEEISFAGTYPEDACIVQAEGTATYGVLVDAQGNLTSTDLIKSSGYPILNNQALEQVKSRSFEQTDGAQSYLVSVDFQYDPEICPSLGAAPPETAESKPQPNPAPAVAPESTQPEITTQEDLVQPAEPETTEEPQQSAPEATSESAPPTELPAIPPLAAPEPSVESTESTPQPVQPSPEAANEPALTVPPSDPASAKPQPAATAASEAEADSTNTSDSEALGGPIEVPNPLMQPSGLKDEAATEEPTEVESN